VVCVAVLCEIFIISCGITGVFCILTGQGTIPLTMLLAGLLLIAGGLVCGMAYRWWNNGEIRIQ
jgi:arginine exporter protein ArgO